MWTVDSWLQSIDLATAAAVAFDTPVDAADHFKYVTGLTDDAIRSRLDAARLSGLAPAILASAARLRAQTVATAAELNDKFAVDGSGAVELAYGSMESFEKGLEGVIGLPFMSKESPVLQDTLAHIRAARAEPTLLGQMELEHCDSPDSAVCFPSQVARAHTARTQSPACVLSTARSPSALVVRIRWARRS